LLNAVAAAMVVAVADEVAVADSEVVVAQEQAQALAVAPTEGLPGSAASVAMALQASGAATAEVVMSATAMQA
jgi:hypothetical protein